MEYVKQSKNVQFDVIYDDGSRKRVKEGILFEAKQDNSTMLHIGTSRQSVFDAFFEAVIEFMDEILKHKDPKITKFHKEQEIEYSAKHVCSFLIKNKLDKLKIVQFKGGKGWYFVDETVTVEGHNGSCYATAIVNCPFCGEKLK